MPPWKKCAVISLAVLSTIAAPRLEACQERVLSLRFSPSAGRANNWCWASAAEMVMGFLGEDSAKACQCRQAEEVLGVDGCCVTPNSCLPADELPAQCDRPRWLPFVEKPAIYAYSYATTCDSFKDRQDDQACDGKPLGWRELTAEICAGRPVIASLRGRGSAIGHTVVVKGFSSRPLPRVVVVDPTRLCPADRDCEGELDEGFWLSYEEYAAGWGGMVHWVDFYGIRRK